VGAADVLRRFAAPRVAAAVEERCDLCKTPLAGEHPHLVDLASRRLLCACGPCALLFDHRGASEGRFKRVPSRRLRLRDLRLGADFWDRLQIPVRLAFFFENSDAQRPVAFYPGPAGATESLLPLDAWREVVAANPVLGSLESDVEAMLLRDRDDGGPECYLVPIDVCYALTGTVRRTWKGFEGGADAWQEIDRFFAELAASSRDAAADAAP
jgi:hypothetical protein